MRYVIFCLIVISLWSCGEQATFEEEMIKPEYLHDAMEYYTDVQVHDIFSPPQASRNYVYPSIAAYEIMVQSSEAYVSMAGQLNGLRPIPALPEEDDLSPSLAAVYAFLLTAQEFIFSEEKMVEYREDFEQTLADAGVPKRVRSSSAEYAQMVSEHILAWAEQDGYKKTRSYSKHGITDAPSSWKPTPPAFMEGIEPHWREIRPMVMDSAQQFVPAPPPEFSLDKSSEFYARVMEVYDAVNEAGQEEKAIASFWDCNPYVMNQTGHMMFATKKITPGGHWMGIAAVACKKSNADMMKSCEAYLLTSIALFDGFISCWDEKYRSNLLRPETYINEHIDGDWLPVLQTPPFPEHTSGHSVISTAAAVALTHVFGDGFSFDDTVELKYGLPVRSFDSFLEASAEAAISRLYGGIHYLPAIEDGVKQGRKIGLLVTESVDTKVEE